MITIAQTQSLGWMAIATIGTALFLGVISSIALSAHPRRLSSQVFALHSGISIIWLYCVYRGMRASEMSNWNQEIEFWGRANSAIVALLPWCLWLLKEAITEPATDRTRILLRSLPLLSLACILATLSYSDSFFAKSADLVVRRGRSYFIYNILYISAYAYLFTEILRAIPKARGIRKIELQFLTLVIAIATPLIIVLNVLGNISSNRILNRASIPIILIGYTIIVSTLTARRIFNPREVFLVLSQKFIVLSFMTLTTLGITFFIPAKRIFSIEFAAAVFGCGACSIWLELKTRRMFGLEDDKTFRKLKGRVNALNRAAADTTQIVSDIEAILREVWDTLNAAVIVDASARGIGTRFSVMLSDKAYGVLCNLGYATPETLERHRKTPTIIELRSFLSATNLSILLVNPSRARSPALAIGLGPRQDGSPFTHTDAKCLNLAAELVDNVVIHSRLGEHASLEARVEHLALMSRGLAHDLKNLITPVASFIGHTKAQFASDSPEAEVHGAAARSVQVMSEYVRESLFFAERLHLRVEVINALTLFSKVKEVLSGQAKSGNIVIDIQCHPRESVQGDAILLQRLLGNLVANAIDASAPGGTVLLRMEGGNREMVLLQVIDHGAGIDPENLGRVFEPYYTTKASGGDARGFGLGLTICQKIVHLHGGRISVSSQVGKGTTVSIELPGPPRSQILPSQACLALS